MSLNKTPSSERIHIGFFGRTNAGKSSLINAITGQEISLVSQIKGTTTDPVKKAMELLPLGPVLLIDTPGLDDDSILGDLRRQRTMDVIKQIHFAVIVVDASEGRTKIEKDLEEELKRHKISYFYVYNKIDLMTEKERKASGIEKEKLKSEIIYVSVKTKENVDYVKEKLSTIKIEREERKLVSDLLKVGDHVLLVIPIDKSAPKGRLILPQQQTIRDILDAGCSLSVCQVENLKNTLEMMVKYPQLVICDSQVFKEVEEIIPGEIMLTSFSVLFARYKGDLKGNVSGAYEIERLEDGDKVLISEGCTHHKQCGDIGSQKLPNWLLHYTGKKLVFDFTSGDSFLSDLTPYKLIIHCGGCMLNEKQMQERIALAKKQKISMTNYGISIAYLNGILERSIEIFSK